MSTRLYIMAAIIVAVATGTILAQPPTNEKREAMKKLEFLVGSWRGEGWMEHGPGQRRTFKGVEIVQLKLDALILTIDGMHRGQVGGKGEEVVVHNAFGLMNFDDNAKRYR